MTFEREVNNGAKSARPILDERDELAMGHNEVIRPEFVENGADCVDEIQVLFLAPAAEIVSFPTRPPASTARMAAQ
jgi:hypothetical protein